MIEKPQPIDWYPSGGDRQPNPTFEPGEGAAGVIYPGKDRIRFDDEGYMHGADNLRDNEPGDKRGPRSTLSGGDQIRPR